MAPQHLTREQKLRAGWKPVDWQGAPQSKKEHILYRLKNRASGEECQAAFYAWVRSGVLVPPGAWFHTVRVGEGFHICGFGPFPTTIRDFDMGAKGIRAKLLQPKFTEVGPPSVLASMGKLALATMSEIQVIITEMMKHLAVGLKQPEVKIVNQMRSRWDGQDSWRPEKPDTTLMELQQRITGDDKTLRRIIAHELCHHEDFLLNWAPLSVQEKAMRIRRKLTLGHGESWQAIAARFNAIYGADFVTKTSDQNTVYSDTGAKYYLFVLQDPKDHANLKYSVSGGMSDKQLAWVKARQYDPEKTPGAGQTKLFHVSNPEFAQGAQIGKGWYRATGKDLEVLQQIWETGTPVDLPAPKKRTPIDVPKVAQAIVDELTAAYWPPKMLRKFMTTVDQIKYRTQGSKTLASLHRRTPSDEEWSQVASAISKIVDRLEGIEPISDDELLDQLAEFEKGQPAEKTAAFDAFTEDSFGDPYLYHGTTIENAKLIKQQGIFPGNDDLAYATSNLQEAKDYARTQMRSEKNSINDEAGDQYAVVIIDKKKANLDGIAGTTYYTPEQGESIPASAIVRVDVYDALDGIKVASTDKIRYGTVQAEFPEDSQAFRAVEAVRAAIDESDLDGKGLRIGPTHITVRYGIQTDDTSTIEAYLSTRPPFLAQLAATAMFPASKHSDDAAVIIAPVVSSELFELNAHLADIGDFKAEDFEYKPHATIAYVKPEAAEKYLNIETTAGQQFLVKEIAVVTKSKDKKIITLNGQPKEAAGGLTEIQAAKEIAGNDAIFGVIAEYTTNPDAFEENPADHQKLLDILRRMRPRKPGWTGTLYRGEPASGPGPVDGQRGFRSFSANYDTAFDFARDYGKDGVVRKTVGLIQGISLETLCTWRMRIRKGESHYSGMQAEWLVLDGCKTEVLPSDFLLQRAHEDVSRLRAGGWNDDQILRSLKGQSSVEKLLQDPAVVKSLFEVNKTANGPAQDQDWMGKPGDITSTSEFKAWFAGSKIVDDHGRPLRVYHGTKAKFDSFNLDMAGSNNDPGMWGTGFYFSPRRQMSLGYGDKLMQVYLSLQNPLRIGDNHPMPEALRDLTRFRADAPVLTKEKANAIRELIIGMGYDGVMQYSNGWKYPGQIVAFYPNQIKSVKGNNGDFDPKNNNITASQYNEDEPAQQAVAEVRTAGWNNAAILSALKSEYVQKFHMLPISKTFMHVWKERGKGKRGAAHFEQFLEGMRKAAATIAPSIPSKITETPKFKTWFSGSKVTTKSGKPLPVYHGTTHDFDTFSADGGNAEGHYGSGIYFTNSQGDADQNYAGVGPDLKSRIDTAADRQWDQFVERKIEDGEIEEEPRYGTDEYKALMAELRAEVEKTLVGPHKGVVMPCYLRMRNPVTVEPHGGTWFEITFDEETGEESGSGLKLYEAFIDHLTYSGEDPQEMWNSVMEKLNGNPEFSAHDFEKAMRTADAFMDVENGPGQWIAGVYREMGFDGIIMDAKAAFPGMKLEPNTKHFIVWQPNQVKSAIGNSGDFDDTKPSITAGKRSKLLQTA